MNKMPAQQKKAIFRYLQLTCGTTFVILIILFSWLKSMDWCHYVGLFQIDTIAVRGNTILSSRNILQAADIPDNTNLRHLDIKPIQNRIEALPYVKAALVSRRFPAQINIRIRERIPICYFNADQLYLIDGEGIVLPLPDTYLSSNLPVLSGFYDQGQSFPPGQAIPESNLSQVVDLLHQTYQNAPELFHVISEMHYRKAKQDYLLYHVDGGAPIYLGNQDLFQKMDILAHFQQLLHNKKQLSDFDYLDLRWANQIVVKENNS